MRLFGAVFALLSLMFVVPETTFAEQRPGPEATQHALDELANAVAQGKITLTPTPTPTLTPTLIPTATATAAVVIPEPTLSPSPTPIPLLPSASQDDPIHGYLRPSQFDGWLELAIPQGRWIVSGTCDLQEWDTVWFWNDGPDLFLNDCLIGNEAWVSDTPCNQDNDGSCDIQLDQSYWNYLGSLPTPVPTDTPQPIPTLLTHINVVSTVAPIRQPEPIHQPESTPVTRYVQSPPQQIIQTVVITKVTTATPTVTPTPTVTVTPSPTATSTPEPTETVVVESQGKQTKQYSWQDSAGDVAKVIGIVIIGCLAAITSIYVVTNR